MAAKDAKSLVRHMPLTGFCLVALLTPILNSDAQGQPLSRGTIVYGAVVERESGRDARVPNAVLSFLGSNGVATEVRADQNGEYSTDLPSGERYFLTVTRRGFCPAHRPSFDARSNRKVKLDVMLTTACPKDLVEVSSEDNAPSSVETEFCARAGIYYCEENIPLSVNGTENLIIGFGKREKTGHLLKYDPTPIRGHAGAEIPVTISFGTYTLQAHQASVDEKLKMLRAEGNVSIADGSSSPPRLVPCAIIQLNDPEPQVRPCPEDGTLDPKTGNLHLQIPAAAAAKLKP
ncbi:MAG: carboxypeptidase-like regulatory domain-containing protein [Candidatus Sulfotelmatobacter sp.]